MLRSILIAVVLLFLPSWAIAEGETKPSRWAGWESHVKFGTQTYMNELEPDPGSAGLGGFLIGYRLSDRSLIGASYGTAAYEIQYLDGTTEAKQVGSLLLTYQYRFRSQRKFQPYLDAGAGIADPIIGYDTGVKGAFTFALGALWKFNEKWAATLESRGVSWSQDDTPDVAEFFGAEGSSVTVASNEFTLGIGYMW